jgi:uncharacterized membrane protein YhaH (DUF805 family)
MNDAMPAIVSWGPVALIALVFFYAVVVYPYVRVLHRTGFSGWWVLLLLVPGPNFIMVWIFAFVKWPIIDQK